MNASEITEQDLRSKTSEIMDAVENGQTFILRSGECRIGRLVPVRRRFVSRDQFVAMSVTAPHVDLEAFRGDQDAALSHDRRSFPAG
ncbi:prevent-host-death protein [Nocardia sp. CA-290969]|uniref:prevent-host-death protein n=1 Tax=Nocardia sp. CA-290969 TaxID=3239986 RepID=UPI003D89DFF3